MQHISTLGRCLLSIALQGQNLQTSEKDGGTDARGPHCRCDAHSTTFSFDRCRAQAFDSKRNHMNTGVGEARANVSNFAASAANAAIFVNSADVLVVDSHSKPSAASGLIAQIRKQVTTNFRWTWERKFVTIPR
jgi:hypothetical protein